MPFALVIIAIALMVTAVRGTTSQFFGLIKSDFTGSGNYLYWVISLLIIGSVGYVKRFQPVANMFLGLVLIVFVLANKGFFNSFMTQIKSVGNCPQVTGNSTDTTNLLAKQAEANPTVMYRPGQSAAQWVQNAVTNMNAAFGTSSTLGGG